jgi:hypothetical protein
MNLIEFNDKTLPGRVFNSPAITLHLNAGRIILNGSVVNMLGLDPNGDRVAIAQDSEQPMNWYLFKHPEGYLFKPVKIGAKPLRGTHKDLCRKIIVEFLERDGSETHRFRIAKVPHRVDGRVLYGILF